MCLVVSLKDISLAQEAEDCNGLVEYGFDLQICFLQKNQRRIAGVESVAHPLETASQIVVNEQRYELGTLRVEVDEITEGLVCTESTLAATKK